MVKPLSFRGIITDARTEYEVKRSRFITTVTYVSTEAEAQEFVERISSEFSDASHNVYAYRAGLGVPVERYSDDGEPSGTSGPPALEVLKQRELTNVALVITRYFGGTKLGGGGLVRAYSHSASVGIDAATEANWTAYQHLTVTIEYSDQGRVEYEVRQSTSPLVDIVYGARVELEFRARHNEVAQWEERLLELTSGRAKVARGEWAYMAEDNAGQLIPHVSPIRAENPPA